MEHRLTKPAHPWTNGQVERMNRTIKEATVKRFHYQRTQELNEHLQAFLLTYNHAKRLKTPRGLTPHEFVCAQWQKNPTKQSRISNRSQPKRTSFRACRGILLESSAPPTGTSEIPRQARNDVLLYPVTYAWALIFTQDPPHLTQGLYRVLVP